MQHRKISVGKFDYDLRTKHEDSIRGEADRVRRKCDRRTDTTDNSSDNIAAADCVVSGPWQYTSSHLCCHSASDLA